MAGLDLCVIQKIRHHAGPSRATPQVKKGGKDTKESKHLLKVGRLCTPNEHTQSIDSLSARKSHDHSLGSLSATKERGAQSGTHSKSDFLSAIYIGVHRGTKKMSSLYSTKANSVITDDEYAGFNEIEDEADEYVFDPQELLDNDLLDEDLDQPSISQKKTIRDPLGVEMFNST
ncbi:hypothetical protein NDU88_002582 [Pleurodeles waltl]|uniref:Uncharacterized protein n=1 Tax=Pleurodeles waltl TaxID=8319 RepID=A0AAV7SAW1_PLEWA|nr:hypothetical protein NDU88_002582 [Pleurodeles waltl]